MRKLILLLAILLIPSLSWAAWGNGGGACGANNKITGTTLVCTVSAQDFEAGNVAIVFFGGDNTNTSDNNSVNLSAVVDSKGNTWTLIPNYTNGNGSAATGATVSAAYSVLTSTLTSGVDTITLTHNSIDARAMVTMEKTKGGGTTVFARGSSTLPGFLVNDAADPGSLTLSGVESAEHLFLRATALERASGGTWTASTNFTTSGCAGTTGGVADTNIEICGEFRINTSTSEASDPTGTAVDSASLSIVLTEKTMPTGFVQECHNGVGSAGTTIVCSFGQNVKAANLIACLTTDMSTTDTVSMSDTLTQSWTVQGTYYADATNTERGVGVYAKNITGGYSANTATWSVSTSHRSISCQEISGMDPTSPADGYVGQSQQNPGTGGNAITSTGITTTGATGYLFGGTFEPSDNCQTVTAGTGWTGAVLTGCQWAFTEAQAVTPGTYSATFTTTNATADYITIIQGFKAAAVSAAPQTNTGFLGVILR